jgi:hypothetical protein
VSSSLNLTRVRLVEAASGVDEDVQPTVALRDVGDKRVYRVLIRDVEVAGVSLGLALVDNAPLLRWADLLLGRWGLSGVRAGQHPCPPAPRFAEHLDHGVG